MNSSIQRAQALARLLSAPAILRMVHVWDVASARTVDALPDTHALGIDARSVAASFGFDDVDALPVDLMLDMVERITTAVDVPVCADLGDGWGDPGRTARRAIVAGVAGVGVEDRLRPLPEAVAAVEAVMRAADAEGVPLVLNARTDAFVHGADRPVADALADALERGRAYLDAGAASVFVPGILDADTAAALVAGLGRGHVSVLGFPGALTPADYERLGVARISYGPLVQRLALTTLREFTQDLYAGSPH